MNSLGMEYSYEQRDPSRRFKGIAVVLVVHVVIGWALVSGTARDVMKIAKTKMEAVMVPVELPPPPPPPPPPKQVLKPVEAPPEAPPPPFVPPPDVPPPATSTAPTIVATAAPPPAPPVIAPPPPVVAPKPKSNDIGVVCPTLVRPEMPRKAMQDGTTGEVRALITIGPGGVVKDVTIQSGPRVFHAPVRAAMTQYKCLNDTGADLVVGQTFNFTLSD